MLACLTLLPCKALCLVSPPDSKPHHEADAICKQANAVQDCRAEAVERAECIPLLDDAMRAWMCTAHSTIIANMPKPPAAVSSATMACLIHWMHVGQLWAWNDRVQLTVNAAPKARLAMQPIISDTRNISEPVSWYAVVDSKVPIQPMARYRFSCEPVAIGKMIRQAEQVLRDCWSVLCSDNLMQQKLIHTQVKTSSEQQQACRQQEHRRSQKPGR